MKHSTDRILTTHAGSLSRPANLNRHGARRLPSAKAKVISPMRNCLASSVADVVKKQRELGVDIPDGRRVRQAGGGSYDYGAWWNYAFCRMSGFSAGGPALPPPRTKPRHKKSTVADVALTSFANRRDWQEIGEFYLDPESSGSLMGSGRRGGRWAGRPAPGRSNYTGHAALQADYRKLEKSAGRDRRGRRFHVLDRPGSFARGVDLYYKTEEEFLFASADAMRERIQGHRRCRHRVADRRSEAFPTTGT